MKKILLLLVLLGLLFSCKNSEGLVKTTQHNCENQNLKIAPVLSDKEAKIYIPFKFTIQNNSYFSGIEYLDANFSKTGGGIDTNLVEFDTNNNLMIVLHDVELSPREELIIQFYIRYTIEKNKENEENFDLFVNYLQTIKKNKTFDALTLGEFKKKYKTLYQEIANKYFIVFRIMGGKNGDRILIPIKF